MTIVSTDPKRTDQIGTPEADADQAASIAAVRALRRHAAAALVVFVLCVGLLAWSWARFDHVRHASQPPEGATRDAVAAAVTKDVATLNTFDSAHVGNALTAWAGVTTGDLHDQMARVSVKERGALANTRSTSTARVAAVAVTGLDGHTGTATAITFVTVAVQPAHGRSHVLRHRYRVELSEVDGRWLVSSIIPVEVAQR